MGGAQRIDQAGGHIRPAERRDVQAGIHHIRVENRLVRLAREVIVGVGIRVGAEILVVEPDVLIYKLVLAGWRSEVNGRAVPGDRRIEKGRDFGRVVAFGAELAERSEKVHALRLHVLVKMNVEHVYVRHHHLFDLAFPPARLAGPVGAAFQRNPRAADLASVGGEPMKHDGRDVVIGRREGRRGREQRRRCLRCGRLRDGDQRGEQREEQAQPGEQRFTTIEGGCFHGVLCIVITAADEIYV